MDNECGVDGCPRPTGDFVCQLHREDLVAALGELADGPETTDGRQTPGLLQELNTTRWKLSRSAAGTGVTSRSATSALMFHAAASDLFWTARNTLVNWATTFRTRNPQLRPPGASADPRELARWMGTFPGLLALMPEAGGMADEIGYLVGEIKRTIDSQPDRRYLGQCSARTDQGRCQADLFGATEKPYAACRECGTLHDTDERRKVLLEAVGGQRATVLDLTRALPELIGRPISVHSVRGWVRKGELISVGKNAEDVALYLVDDFVTVVIAKATRQRGPNVTKEAIVA